MTEYFLLDTVPVSFVEHLQSLRADELKAYCRVKVEIYSSGIRLSLDTNPHSTVISYGSVFLEQPIVIGYLGQDVIKYWLGLLPRTTSRMKVFIFYNQRLVRFSVKVNGKQQDLIGNF